MIYPTFAEEKKLWNQGCQLVAGVDEVGRGAWAGPVVAAAVILPAASPTERATLLDRGLRDSKLLTPKRRAELATVIREVAVAFALHKVAVRVIDRIGIGRAAQRAMLGAIKKLNPPPDFSLVDFYLLEQLEKEKQKALKLGDKLCASIAAASILAKVHRDRLMVKLHKRHPRYDFARHKGYGTKFHQEALIRYGPCRLHRTSFIPRRLAEIGSGRAGNATP